MVDSSSKNKNIKDQLLNKLEDYSFKNKIKSITFLTHKKDNSLSYYRKKGFNKEYHIISMRKDIF